MGLTESVLVALVGVAKTVIEGLIKYFTKDAPNPAPIIPEGYSKEVERRKRELEEMERLIDQQNKKYEEERHKDEQELHEIQEDLKRKEKKLCLKKENFDALKKKRFEIRDPEVIRHCRAEAIKKFGINSEKKYNIAITGQTGSGKSSLVNAVRGLMDDDVGAANVNEEQVLTPMTKYQHPYLKSLYVWDCPGAGTAYHPLETYFMDKYLYMFDGLVIVYENRFQEVDADLLFQANAFGVPVVVVRNKANNDLNARMRRKKEFGNLSHEAMKINLVRELKDAARVEIEAQEAKIGIHLSDRPIFVINAWAMTDACNEAFEEAAFIEYVLTTTKERRGIHRAIVCTITSP